MGDSPDDIDGDEEREERFVELVEAEEGKLMPYR